MMELDCLIVNRSSFLAVGVRFVFSSRLFHRIRKSVECKPVAFNKQTKLYPISISENIFSILITSTSVKVYPVIGL